MENKLLVTFLVTSYVLSGGVYDVESQALPRLKRFKRKFMISCSGIFFLPLAVPGLICVLNATSKDAFYHRCVNPIAKRLSVKCIETLSNV